jgi:hypothetical protein
MDKLYQNIKQNHDTIKSIIAKYNLLYKSYYFEFKPNIKSLCSLSTFDDNELYLYNINLDNSDRRHFFIKDNLESKLSILKKNPVSNLCKILNIFSQIYNCELLFDDKWIKVKKDKSDEYINSISGEDMEDKRFKLFLKQLYKFGDAFDIDLNMMSYELVDYDDDVKDCEKIFLCTITI